MLRNTTNAFPTSRGGFRNAGKANAGARAVRSQRSAQCRRRVPPGGSMGASAGRGQVAGWEYKNASAFNTASLEYAIMLSSALLKRRRLREQSKTSAGLIRLTSCLLCFASYALVLQYQGRPRICAVFCLVRSSVLAQTVRSARDVYSRMHRMMTFSTNMIIRVA